MSEKCRPFGDPPLRREKSKDHTTDCLSVITDIRLID